MKSARALALLSAQLIACSAGDPMTRQEPPASGGTSSSLGGSAGSANGGGGAAGSAAAGAPAGGQAGSASGGAAGSAGGGGTAGGGGSGGAPGGYCGQRSGLLFCDDFEDQADGSVPASAPWSSAVNGDGVVIVDSTTSHSGNRAVKVTGSGFSTFLVFADPAILPVAGGRFFVRAFMRIAEPMSGGHNTFIVADLASAPGTGNAVRIGEMNAMLMYTVSGDTHGALANDNYYNDHLTGAALTAGSYGCLEFVLDSSKPELDVWLDGVEIPDLHHTDWALDPYDALRFGFEKYAGPVTDVWYDDIAIGTEPIGCE